MIFGRPLCLFLVAVGDSGGQMRFFSCIFVAALIFFNQSFIARLALIKLFHCLVCFQILR